MNRQEKAAFSLYLLLLAASSIALFHPTIRPSYLFGIFLLVAAYIYPITIGAFRGSSRRFATLFLVLTTIFSMLVVIDPVEIGLYGYDPYIHTFPAYEFMQTNPSFSEFINSQEEWPGFYVFVTVLETVGIPISLVSKYIPLIAGAAPLFFYLGLSRVLNNFNAFLIAMGFASTRTLLLFEGKFISESMAIGLLFFAVMILFVTDGRRRKIALFITILALCVTHHVTALFAILLLTVWPSVSGFLEYDYVPSRLRPVQDSVTPLLAFAAVSSIIFVLVFLYGGGNFARWVLATFTSSLQVGSGSEVAGLSGGEQTIRGLVAQGALPLFVIFALIVSAGQFSMRRQSKWTTGWTAFAGLIAVLYVISLAVGAFIPLDPIRFLIILVPFLLASTVAVLTLEGGVSSDSQRQALAVILVVALIVTQLAAIPAHVLISNPSQTTIGEGHYSASQWAASDWVDRYSLDRLWVYERGLWVAGGTIDVVDQQEAQTCGGSRVWRADTGHRSLGQSAIVYSAGRIAIEKC